VAIVAERLGNTVAICKSCYIHPLVFERYLDGSLPELLNGRGKATGGGGMKGLSHEERALLGLLERA
jgi:DNA topoisomerase-1